VLVTHDIEEAIKVGDLVALFRPHGKIAQLAPPEELLAAPVDDYVADFVGFDRGIRRLSFVSTAGLTLDTGAVLPAEATVAAALAAGRPWICVTEAGRPRGWVDTSTIAALPGDTALRQVRAEPIGHPFTLGTDTLRAALDAAVLSPAGQAIAVDSDGLALGAATFDRLRAAIQAADGNDGQDARQVQHAEGPPS
jgi:osmoprotectant transport system ATP-binding protein